MTCRISCCFAILLIHTTQQIQAAVSIDFDADFRECGNGDPMPALDLSQFEIIPLENGSVVMNGSGTFIGNYESPTKWKLRTERLERGKWVPGIVSRDIPNICATLTFPPEPWYPYTRHLQQQYCPFRAGHVEYVDNVNIGNLGKLFAVPPSFIGEWRVYHYIITTRNGRPTNECFMIPTTVSEA